MKVEKLKQSVAELEHALSFEDRALEDKFYFSGIAKSFEVALEYSWKYLQDVVNAAGLEAPSPRDAIKQAAKIGEIEDVDAWLEFLRTRNIAVHDYLGITPDTYLKIIKKFKQHVDKLL